METCALHDGVGDILLAAPDKRAVTSAPPSALTVLIDNTAPLSGLLAQALRLGWMFRSDHRRRPATEYAAVWPAVVESTSPGEPVNLVFQANAINDGGLERSIAHLAAILEAVQTAKCRLWIVVRGLDSSSASAIDPMAEALWCFARVAINEYPSVQLKLVDIAATLDATVAARHLAGLLRVPGTESELLIDAAGVAALRTLSGLERERRPPVPSRRPCVWRCGPRVRWPISIGSKRDVAHRVPRKWKSPSRRRGSISATSCWRPVSLTTMSWMTVWAGAVFRFRMRRSCCGRGLRGNDVEGRRRRYGFRPSKLCQPYDGRRRRIPRRFPMACRSKRPRPSRSLS